MLQFSAICALTTIELPRDLVSLSVWLLAALVWPCTAVDGGVRNASKTLLDDCVAFARRHFQARAVKDLNRPSTVADKFGRLHRLRRKRRGFPIGAQYVRKEFVCVRGAIHLRPDRASLKAIGTSFPPSCAWNCMRRSAGLVKAAFPNNSRTDRARVRCF
jgi:hypothetical protein